jgi:hypothetical protein
MIKQFLKVISVSAVVLVGLPLMNEMGKSDAKYDCKEIKTTCETYTQTDPTYPGHIKHEVLCDYLFGSGSPFFPGLAWTQKYCERTLPSIDKETKTRCALLRNYAREHKECE